MPVTPRVGYAHMPIFILDVGNDENFRVIYVTPLTENMDLELTETPTEIDVLLRSQLLIAKQQHGMLLKGISNDGEAVVIDGPGEIEPAYLGAQNRVRGIDGNCHDDILLDCPLCPRTGTGGRWLMYTLVDRQRKM